jgi:hypothetical protein
MPIRFSFIEEEMQKCFPVYINRSHFPWEGAGSLGGSSQSNGLGT